MRRDPVIAMLIRQHGECGLASSQRTDPFHALLHAIIAQQLSTKAARTIEGRLSALFDGGPTPDVLLDITEGWERKRKAMEIMGAQSHLVTYYTELGRRRGTQAVRNSGPNLGLPQEVVAEAYQRVFPQVTKELA